MTKLFVLLFAAVSSAAVAQTPAANPMPDGSHDMYVGLGVVSKPRYTGSAEREASVLPVLQFQWSNGVFVSGLGAGLHMARSPQVEFGPLLEVQPGRDDGGNGDAADGTEGAGASMIGPLEGLPAGASRNFSQNRLAGMDRIHARLQGGGFLNLYLTPAWRLTSRALYGAGNDRHGARFDLGVQRLAVKVGAQHRVTLAAGVTLVNRSHNAAFFGVTEEESARSGNARYSPGGGLKDVHLGARWNWTLAPDWVLTSNVQANRLLDDARRSPLVARPTSLTASTAVAYRF